MSTDNLPPAETKSVTNPQLAQWLAPHGGERKLDTRYLPARVFTLPKIVNTILAKVLKINDLLPVFHAIPPNLSPDRFSTEGLKNLGIAIEEDPDMAQKVPAEGPLVIVCNHPFGGIDGMALMAALLKVRPDAKLLINVALGIFPDLRACCLPLNVLETSREARALNMASLRHAREHLQHGGCVVFFPSGTVSHWQRGKGIVDPDWQTTPARFAQRHGAPLLPIYFHGRNSLFFNAAGAMHPMLRTLLLPREMLVRRGKPIRFTVGRLVEPSTFKILGKPEAIIAYLRMRCYGLKNEKIVAPTLPERPMEPVADPHPQALVSNTFANLPPECLLHREGNYAVYIIKSGQAPMLLEELGALREHTFRLVGEGSGKARDLDTYDERYYHMLLWHEVDRVLVGAYRLGKMEEIIASHGPSGLYTTSLFRMSKNFFRRYAHSLELGRAVVHPLYQREYQPLMLLWKGIGKFVLRNEDIHCLFGPVSLSLDYDVSSLRAAVDYLTEQCGSAELSAMVKGRYFPEKLFTRASEFPLPDTLNFNGLVTLVRDIEGGRGIPILFKHYLKLGGKIAAFHMDTTFNTLDAFLLMDLVYSPRSMLERYMTPEGAKEFLERWGAGHGEEDNTRQ